MKNTVLYVLYHLDSGHRDRDFTLCGVFESEQDAINAEERILKNAPRWIKKYDFWIAAKILGEVDEHPFLY